MTYIHAPGNNIGITSSGVSEGLTIGYVIKCASNPIPGLSLLFLHHPCMLLFGIHWIFICLSRFLLCYAQCCHGNGSGVRHVPFAMLAIVPEVV